MFETSGGVSPPFLRHVGRLHRRTRTPGAVDRTHYGSVRMSPTSYFVHHTQQLSKAAVVGKGASIRRRIDVLKQKACNAARPLPRTRLLAGGTRRKPPPLRGT